MEEKKKLKLFYKFFHKQSTREEYEEFINECGKKDGRKEYGYLFDGYSDLLRAKGNFNSSTEKLTEEAGNLLETAKRKERLTRQRYFRRLNPTFSKIAAVFIVALTLSALLYYVSGKRQDNIVLYTDNTNISEKNTGFGEISEVLLSDGSNVKLNARSKISFDETFSGNTREVNLTGQAFFDVAEDENKPFVIKTGTLQVTVLGTAFDVNSYDENDFASITVVRGKVRVNSPDKEYIITPNEQICFDKKTGAIIKRDVDSEIFTKWINGTLYFDHTSVQEMLYQLERWYNIEFHVNNPGILSKTVSGEYTNEKLTSILEALAYSLNIEYDIEGRTITLK